jgi:hypothetical protein
MLFGKSRQLVTDSFFYSSGNGFTLGVAHVAAADEEEEKEGVGVGGNGGLAARRVKNNNDR